RARAAAREADGADHPRSESDRTACAERLDPMSPFHPIQRSRDMRARMLNPVRSALTMGTKAIAIAAITLLWEARAQAASSVTEEGRPVQVNVGQSVVLDMQAEVSTVSIADPRVADAAVGSERTVVINGKGPGVTSLVVWEEGGHHTLY